MTRSFNQHVNCPNCGATIDAETDFCRWMRDNDKLDSAIGIVRADMDHIVHRYKTNAQGREFQLLMVVEVKTRNASPAQSQIDTLAMINQLMRNRSQNMHKKPKRQAGNGINRLMSYFLRREVLTRCYGVHLLQFSGTGPHNSESILWDGKPINEDTLTGLMALEIDPDTLRPVDLRDHHRKQRQPPLVGFEFA